VKYMESGADLASGVEDKGLGGGGRDGYYDSCSHWYRCRN